MAESVPLLDPADTVHRYRVTLDHAWLAEHFTLRADEVSTDAEYATLRREKNSHRGIGERRSLRTLVASAVNQPFFDEICELEGLEHLELGWPVTLDRLDGIRRLSNLKVLKIDSPRNVTDFSALLDLPSLRYLFIENAKHLEEIDWLVPFGDRLRSLGIEGSIWTNQRVPSLRPLAGLGFEALFLTSVQLQDKDLTPLADCKNLKLLACARFAPKESFDALKALRPDIQCSWFDRYDI